MGQGFQWDYRPEQENEELEKGMLDKYLMKSE